MTVQFTLKSGAQVQVEMEEFTFTGLSKLEWTSVPDAYPRLVKLRLDEIVAVVRLTA